MRGGLCGPHLGLRSAGPSRWADATYEADLDEVAIARAVAGTRVALTRDEMREAVRRLDAAGRPATHLGISGGTLRRLRAEIASTPTGDEDTTTARRSA